MNHAGRGGFPDAVSFPVFCAHVFETRVPGLF